jgi:carbon-monoxide dehydrogenase medium subunit
MIPASFDYVVAKSLDDAVDLLSKHGEDARVLSGGHSLVPLMKMRLAAPSVLIDLGRIPELRFIRDEGDEIVIGGMTTHHMLESSPLLREQLPLLAETAAHIGDAQVRNRGTIGGSLVHADPASDLPAPMLALDAVFTVVGLSGSRHIPAESFFVDLLQSAVQKGEILSEVRIRKPAAGSGSAYMKMVQSASGFAIVGAAALVVLDGSVCSDIRIGVTGVGLKPFRARSVEDRLRGSTLDTASVRGGCKGLTSGIEVLSDIHASAEYRQDLAEVYVRRSVETAANRARGHDRREGNL